jgi:hypothetical protein
MKRIEHIFKSLKREGENAKLSEEAKRTMRLNVLEYVNSHPIQPKKIISPYFSRFSLLMKFSSVAAVAVIVIGSTLYAAGNALPGDLLYPLKVNINEEVKGFFIIGDSNNVAWSEEKVSQRLQEAETLATEGKLDANTQAELGGYFEENIKEFNQRLDEIKKTDLAAAATASAHFETVLKVHQALLNHLDTSVDKPVAKIAMMAATSSSPRPPVNQIARLVKNIDDTLASSSNSRTAIEVRLVDQDSIDANEQIANQRLVAAELSLHFASSSVTALMHAPESDLTEKINLAETLILQGKVQLQNKDYKTAAASFTRAKLLSDEARILIQVERQLLHRAEKAPTGETIAGTATTSAVEIIATTTTTLPI